MNTLPNELLTSILIQVPQRHLFGTCSTVCQQWKQVIYQPLFFSVIDIYSYKQLDKLIEEAKKKHLIATTIKEKNKKPMFQYIQRLNIHFKCCSFHINDGNVFSNLQFISGLHFSPFSHSKIKSIYLQMNQPTQFSLVHYNDTWITKFNNIKNNLKSLDIHITEDFTQYEEPFNTIYLQQIGRKHVNKKRIYSSSNVILIKTLILSSGLIHLTHLKMDFYFRSYRHVINEQTFENIHQSCPLLESLTVEDFYMDIFDDTNYNNEYNSGNKIKRGNKGVYEPANQLKTLKLIQGNFDDPRCFIYIAKKYPNLETLHLCTYYNDIYLDHLSHFDQAIFNMLVQLPSVKNLSFVSGFIGGKIELFESTNLTFVEWLYQHPNQLSHLEYENNLIMNKSFNNDDVYTLKKILLYKQRKLQPQQEQQIKSNPIFLNYLTSLSLNINHLTQLALISFSQNKNTFTVSNVLKSLKIKQSNCLHMDKIYIYDWLDIFPNLISLNATYILRIIDNSQDDLIDDEKDIDHLHLLIKKRKEKYRLIQKWKQLQDKLKIKRSHCKTLYHNYKLNHLKLKNGTIEFKNGLDELLNKCPQLKKLQLLNLTFNIYPTTTTSSSSSSLQSQTSSPSPLPIYKVHFDLPYLHLEFLHIVNLYYKTFNQREMSTHIHKIVLVETSTGCERIFSFEENDRNNYYGFSMECKYIDRLLCQRL
ncbi:unnamed protein product [Cunninghamella blakesleeana]